ncbi:adenosylcobinamide-GDP ribazoletransferase [Anoxybacteroides tepidamans]|uniref:adenosylcobinamide-GDP ribazoletransferase n=1 Tax=Anoxybacteroides tepidamans TaxID=265948 RepID=UPI000489C02A|nr:adenosylcobinamide-GDP ribazoletransferase [Anoxybacillus tepidamans]
MRPIWHGFVLALQFLTIVPLRMEVSWERETARWSVRAFPLVGVLLGGVLASVYYVLSHLPVSSFFVALSLLFLSVFLPGGLHADGWMDVSDAFFSYRDAARRLEIMKDSRVGAFAVLSIMFLLSFRFLFLYETISAHISSLLFIVVPFFSRAWMALLLASGRLAKPTGMAAAFREHLGRNDIFWLIAALLLGTALVSLLRPLFAFILAAMAFVFFSGARVFYEKQFGGITGDMLGAFVEGAETWLWFIIWLLHFFVTA